MEIISTMGRGDLINLYFSQMLNKRAVQIPVVILCFGIVFLTVVQIVTDTIGWTAIIFIYAVIILWVFSMWWSLNNLAKGTSAKLPRIIRLTEEGIETESDQGKKVSAWNTIIEFKKTKYYYFVYFSKSSFMPVKLLDVNDRKEFEATLKSKIHHIP